MAPATTLTPEDQAADRAGVPVLGAVAVALAALVVLATTTVSLVGEVVSGRPLTPYVAPQYWLDYQGGFLRRALPGEVLRLLTPGPAPTYAAVKVVGVALSVAAVLAVGTLALLLARRAPDRWTGLAVAAVVLVGPLGLPLLARDLGRYDAVGVLVLVALTAVPWSRLPVPVAVAAAAVLAAVAVASEEFLVILVVPVALVALWPLLRRQPHPGAWAAVVALPPFVLAALSAVLPVPTASLRTAVATARAAGVPPSVPLVPGQSDHDAVSRLAYGFVDNVRTYYSILTPAGVAGTTVVWAAVYLVLLGLVWHLTGRRLQERAFVLLVVGGGLAALALSVAGIDFRRWWTLAAVAVLCLVHLLAPLLPRPTPRAAGDRQGDPVVVLALVALGTTGVMLADVPAYWILPWWR
jgi:hypothetical protein